MGRCRGFDQPINSQPTITVHACGAQLDAKGQPVPPQPDGSPTREMVNFPGLDDYVVIHIVKWKDLVAGSQTQEVDKQNWYVYNSRKDWDDTGFATNNRIFGQKKFYLLYVHFNRNSGALYNIRYSVKVASKISAYLDHLVQLGQLAGIGTSGGAAASSVTDVWNAHEFEVDYVPSDLTLTPTILPQAPSGKSVDLSAKTFDNEGKYHTDFSIGVPITKINELSYASNSNTLVPASVNKQSLFALFDFYPKAFDIKTSAWSQYPHVVAGVAMDNKPLQKALLGIGYGPIVAHFYAGLLLHTYQLPKGVGCGTIPSVSQTNGVPISNRTCPEFSFGLNVAVGAIADTLKNGTSSKSQ
jgi:hypothetical protein